MFPSDDKWSLKIKVILEIWKWRYNWNIVESGVKHLNPTLPNESVIQYNI